MPQALDVDWLGVKADFSTGRYDLKQLASKWCINYHTVRQRCSREGWNDLKKQVSQAVSQAIAPSIVQAIDPAKAWVSDTIERGKRYRKIIDNSVKQLSPTQELDNALIDVDAIDGYTKSEQRIDDFTRRSLGLIDKPETTVNVSNSISLENYQSNLALIDRLYSGGKLSGKMIDMESLEQASLDLATKQGFMPVRSTDQAMQDLYDASALAKQQELDKVNEPAKPVSEEEAGSL